MVIKDLACVVASFVVDATAVDLWFKSVAISLKVCQAELVGGLSAELTPVSLLPAGALSVALHVWPEGPAAELASGGPDQALWQPQERGQRHQEPQVVRHHRLDRHLQEGGEGDGAPINQSITFISVWNTNFDHLSGIAHTLWCCTTLVVLNWVKNRLGGLEPWFHILHLVFGEFSPSINLGNLGRIV